MPASPRPIASLLFKAQVALRVSQTGLGKIMGGVSRRTVWRYQSGRSTPFSPDLHTLVRHVFPVDPGLAEQLAVATGQTLESLGLVVPAPPPVANHSLAVQPEPPVDPRQDRLRVEAVVCAAADTLDVSPRAVRAALHAAFARAKEMGLSVDVVEEALAPKLPEAPKKNAGSKAKLATTSA